MHRYLKTCGLFTTAICAGFATIHAQSVTIQLQSQSHGWFNEQLASPGTVALAHNVGHATANWIDNGQGEFSFNCAVGALAGPSADFENTAIASVTCSLTKSVCLIPLDSQGNVETALLGTTAVVIFSGSGAFVGSSLTYTPNAASGYHCSGEAFLQSGIGYYINGQFAGGYNDQREYGEPSCHSNYVAAGANPSAGIAIVLGSSFNITMSAILKVAAMAGPVQYNPAPIQNAATASAQVSCSLGFPSLATTGGVSIPNYVWMDRSSGGGIPLNPNVNFDLPIGTPYCFGDGASTSVPCPCGNSSAAGAGRGCANLSGVGSRLSASGSTSVAADNTRFSADDLTGNIALLFVGTDVVGMPMGDGLRCVGGTFRRLGIQSPNAQLVASWGLGLANAGGWQPGDTRRFQVWYRDGAASPCPSANNVNFSNGLEITFTP